ncbi:hypothetical protein [Micromonospora sp. NPDC049891]|uniref:hypothetical protein n=1 Tax=Micromonospora sp. NPDC049891 TaxID=3155655 RepID=UPI0033C236E2
MYPEPSSPELDVFKERAAGPARPSHTPLRPTWCCRTDGQPWPCGEARLLLRVEYEHNRTGLPIYLAGLMCEAMRDLYHLNPHDAPTPPALFSRFLAWTRPATAPSGPPIMQLWSRKTGL